MREKKKKIGEKKKKKGKGKRKKDLLLGSTTINLILFLPASAIGKKSWI